MAATVSGLDYTGLKEAGKALTRLGTPDAEIKDALQNAGAIIGQEALRLMPVKSGRMAKSLKVNRSKSSVNVVVGNNTTIPYAYNFHAQALGKSKGGYTFKVPAHTRAGSQVKAYRRNSYIPNNPFMITAFNRTQDKVYQAFVEAFGRLFQEFGNG